MALEQAERDRIEALLARHADADLVALYDIAQQTATYLQAVHLECENGAASSAETEYWRWRALAVHRTARTLPADDRVGIAAYLDAWQSELGSLRAVGADEYGRAAEAAPPSSER